MVTCSAFRSSGLLCVALIGILPVWVASCGDAPREDCARLRELLAEVSAGVSAWRCTSAVVEKVTAISLGNDENSCASVVESPCIGAFPAEGKFACGPKDCPQGTPCVRSTGCDRTATYRCTADTVDEPCVEDNCACAYAICTTTGFSACETGVDGDVWVLCSEYVCGSS